MVIGLGIRAAVVEKLVIRHDLGTRKTFRQNIGLQCRLLEYLAGDLEAFQRHLPVMGIGPVIGVDQRRGGRVGG